MIDLTADIGRLASGAAAWAGQPAAARSQLALEAARSTAVTADAWVAAALAIKEVAGPAANPAVRAEETATGPLGTLRLLLLTAGSLADISRTGLPRLPRPPRLAHRGSDVARIEVEPLPAHGPSGSLHDAAIFPGHRATVRCVDPGGVEVFLRSWREEAARRPRAGGVALVLGAGNVTGLAPGDCISQIFEHGRAVLLKLHPLHAPLAPVLAEALAPLVGAGLLAIHVGGPELVEAAVAAPQVGHVHLTGGSAAFEAIVWGQRDRHGPPRLAQSITCELGNVTPWFIVPGRYSPQALARQADMVAASIVHNTSFNCIATKLLVTARSWQQREAFLGLVQSRLAAASPRMAWYPGAAAAWAAVAGRATPADGTLPWTFRTGIDPRGDSQLIEREWFVPVAAELPLAGDSIEGFCAGVHELVARLPGSLAASVTLPDSLPAHDRSRIELLVEHLPFGVVAINTWSALAYSFASVPWGGYPGATLVEPRSGIGFVHDPLLLPLVHNTIVRAPLAPRLLPAWFPWHRHGATLARGLVDVYAGIAQGGRGLWPLVRMLPAVFSG
jgi:acyl-CoA reductase-like NAD-dependent aldehyde dehydrogenase